MNETKEQLKDLIAPCGMNCRLCLAYQREKNHCNGCNIDDSLKTSVSCLRCIIKNCPVIKTNESGFCYECEKFPCLRLNQLDKRYKTKYRMSMLENLSLIKENGIEYFLQREEKRWTCPICGEIVCVHRNLCPKCKTDVSEVTGGVSGK